MKTNEIVKSVIKEQPIKVKEEVNKVLTQKIADKFKEGVGKK